jgi:hypothetical protein
MRIITNYVLFLTSCLSTTCLAAQTHDIEILGKVIDKKSQLPLPFANCYIKDKEIGASTNKNGEFSFFLNDIDINDTLLVSYLGYETNKYPLKKINGKKIVITLSPKDLELNEIVVYPKIKNIKKFMKGWIKNYGKNSVKSPHIAVAHYREKAKQNGNYIMYTESLGYSIFLGKLWNSAPLSNYKFYYKNTRKSVSKPEWIKYTKLHPEVFSEIPPSGSLTLNCFRQIEYAGLLSKKGERYNYTLDSIYTYGNREVYSIKYSYDLDKGNIEIYRDNFQLKRIICNSVDIWSSPLNKIIRGQAIIDFINFNNHSFISSISTFYNSRELEHWNKLSILIYKLSDFKVSKNEYWSINANEINPLVQYLPEKWEKWGIREDEDYSKIANELKSDTLSLDQQFKYNSGKYFINYDNEKKH